MATQQKQQKKDIAVKAVPMLTIAASKLKNDYRPLPRIKSGGICRNC
jgi:hypothetical protein